MATTLKESFGSSNQTITITLASLTSSATDGRESTAIDNSANLYIDALVFVRINMPGSGTIANDKCCYVYAYGTANGGTNYSDTATGSDAAITLSDPANMRLIGVVNCPTNTGTYNGGPFSVAAAFGGTLPEKWGIVVRNYTGLTLNASGSSAFYQGVYGQSV